MRAHELLASSLAPSRARRLALGLAGLRVGLGALAFVAPSFVGRPWIGDDARRPPTKVFARSLGGRDIALGLGALLAAQQGLRIRGWIEAGALADSADTVSTLVGFSKLPRRSRLLVLGACVGAAATGALLAPLVDQ